MPVPKGRKGVAVEMHKFKVGTLHSGSKTGPVVKSRRQAKAIALSEAGLSRRPAKTGLASEAGLSKPGLKSRRSL